MKILSIVSSFRKDGNTERIVKLIEEKLASTAKEQDIPLQIERISLGHCRIELCRGCRICFDKGEDMCPLKDDVLSIRDKILEADGLILASPVYVEDINGIMKNWIDRMAFNCHRPSFAGKPAGVVATSGGGSSNHTINTMSNALRSWGINIAGQDRFRAGALTDTDELKGLYHDRIESIAQRLLGSIKSDGVLKPSFYSLVVFKLQQSYWQKTEKYRDTFDYEYWINKGWLEQNCMFYKEHGANAVKVKAARLIGGIVALFFK